MEVIRKNFVPAAIDLRSGEHPKPGLAEQESADRKLRRAWGGLEQHRPVGVHVVTPEGKVVASFNCRYVASGEKSPAELLGFLKAALKSMDLPERKLKPAPLIPERGMGVRPDGSIRLAVTARPMQDGKPANHRPVFESAYLTAKQFQSLVPAKIEAGASYTIPEDTVRQLTTALTDDGDDVFRIRPAEATKARLQAEVTAITNDRVAVRVAGELAGKRASSERVVEGQARLDGLLVFDRQGKLQSLVIVAAGQYRSPWARQAHAVGGLIEWKASANGSD